MFNTSKAWIFHGSYEVYKCKNKSCGYTFLVGLADGKSVPSICPECASNNIDSSGLELIEKTKDFNKAYNIVRKEGQITFM